jgi:hypothetical protein
MYENTEWQRTIDHMELNRIWNLHSITYDINFCWYSTLETGQTRWTMLISYASPRVTVTAIISAERRTVVLVARAIATTISSDLLDKRSPRIGAIIFGFLIGFVAFLIPDPNAPITAALLDPCLLQSCASLGTCWPGRGGMSPWTWKPCVHGRPANACHISSLRDNT